MKRAKIMLMSIAVLATVGTALAFKVVKKGNTSYCYLTTTVAPGIAKGKCPDLITSATAATGVTAYYYTTLTASSCAQQASCINQAESFTP